MNVTFGILITLNVSEVISASFLSVVMLTETIPFLHVATKKTSRTNKSLLILKAIFGSSTFSSLRSRVLFV